MNVLTISLDKGIFRPNSKVLERTKEYSDLIDKMFVIVWTKKREQPIIFQDKLFIYSTNSRSRTRYYFDTQKIVREIMKDNKIDLISTQDPFETGLVGWLIARMNKIPLQLQVHTDFLSPYFWRESLINKARVVLAKFLIQKVKILRVVSERIKESIMSNIKCQMSNIFVLPIFVDVKRIQEEAITSDLHKKYPRFNFIILMASRMVKEKNISLAIRVMATIIRRDPRIGIIIVGGGPEEKKLKLEIQNLKLADNVVLEPWNDDIYSYYKTADLFLLTSNYEGFGLSVIEAMAAGCPVVMTDVGCAGMLIKNMENAAVVSVGDEDKIVSAVLNLISNAKLRAEFRERGKIIGQSLPDKSKYLQLYLQSWLSAL